jgi:ubiquinone/menaquinone biosynthesis C-methylase UbiE
MPTKSGVHGAPTKAMFNDPQFTKMYKTGEKFTGIWAKEVLERTNFAQDLATKDKLVILDNACGTGIVSKNIHEMAGSNVSKLDLTCADFAEGMINVVQDRIDSTPWPNTKAVIADVQVCAFDF